MNNTEVAIIGAGPGGYSTAIRLQQKGVNVVLFEKEKLGGECLNWGCIPTKAMVKSAELYSSISHLSDFGINVESHSLDFHRLMQRKSEVVKKLTDGLQYMFNKRKIRVVSEEVCRISRKGETFSIETNNASEYKASYVVLATGSKPMEIPSLPFDSKYLLSSRDILGLETLPKHLTIVGGGTIGCEFASIFTNLGVQIEIVELLSALLSNEDKEIARKLTTSFKKKKIVIHTDTKVNTAEIVDGKVSLSLTSASGKSNKDTHLETDRVLISTGRIAECKIDFANIKIEKDRERMVIDDNMETAENGLFAIGDVTGKLMLAHTATKQGLMVADIIEHRLNNKEYKQQNLNYVNIPRCTFTDPELASVGITEEMAQQNGNETLIGKFSYSANGKALALGCKDGFIKVIADKQKRNILGMHIIGAEATELIALGSIIINTGLTIDDLHTVVYAHPTVSEVVMEAIEDLDSLAIHKI